MGGWGGGGGEGVFSYNNIGIKKYRITLLWVLKFGHVGELPQHFLKNTLEGRFFENMVPNFIISEVKVSDGFVVFFFSFRYVNGRGGRVLGYNSSGVKKYRKTFLWLLNFAQVGELPQLLSKTPLMRGLKKKSQLHYE